MQCKCSRTSVPLAARCATFVALVVALPAHAQQLVIVDQTYTASADNTEQSHFVAELQPGIPASLVEPTDYANGRFHVELEILEAPSDTLTNYNICLHNSSGYACLPYLPYMGRGSYDAEPVFNRIWNYGEVDWSQGISKVELILKNEGEMYVHADPDFYPYRARLKLFLVAEGASFDPTMESANDPDDEPKAGSGGSPATGGRGGSAAQGGESGSEGGSSAGEAGTGGTVATAGSSAATAGASAAAGGGAAGGASTKPAQPVTTAGRSGSAGIVAIGEDAGTPTSESRRISDQLENTSGCSISAPGATDDLNNLWPLLPLALLATRRRKRAA